MSKIEANKISSKRYFIDFDMEYDEYRRAYALPIEERMKIISKRMKTFDTNGKNTLTVKETTKIQSMTWLEELSSILVLGLGVPGFVFAFPVFIIIAGLISGSFINTLIIAFVLLLPLVLIPIQHNENVISSWICFQLLQYFSMKFIYRTQLPKDKPFILVAPPHGVFPYGESLYFYL